MRALALLAAVTLGCESVPSLTFAVADGAPPDGPLSDGGGDGTGPEAGDAGCNPQNLPPGASACCGNVPCNGNCLPAECAMCQFACPYPGELCCAKQTTVMCRPLGSACP